MAATPAAITSTVTPALPAWLVSCSKKFCPCSAGWHSSPIIAARHESVPGLGCCVPQLGPCRQLLGERQMASLCIKPAPCSAPASWARPSAGMRPSDQHLTVRSVHTDSTKGAESAVVTSQLAHLADGARCQHENVLAPLHAWGAICVLMYRSGCWPMSHTCMQQSKSAEAAGENDNTPGGWLPMIQSHLQAAKCVLLHQQADTAQMLLVQEACLRAAGCVC